MKITSIKFLNLNSLKGEHEIRFDKSPFTESELFAITGPTGAGKTTLLDAITIALYGQMPRQKDVAEIMTRHTDECYSEVEFETKDQLYRSKWSVRKSRNGILQTPKMEFANLTTHTFEGGHTLNAVKQAIINVCGLDYNQFLRSVMLSQGEFTRFLKADERERSELLEKLTDTEIYSRISKHTYEKAKQEKDKLEQLQYQLKEVNLLSEDTLNEYISRTKQILKDIALKTEEKDIWQNHLKVLRTISRLREKKMFWEKELEANALKCSAIQPLIEQLNQHNRVQKYREALFQITADEKQMEQLDEKLSSLSLQLPAIESDLASLSEQKEATERLLQDAENELIIQRPIIAEVQRLDVRIEAEDREAVREQQIHDNDLKQLRRELNSRKNKLAEIEDLKGKITSLEQWIESNSSDRTLQKEIPLLYTFIEKAEESSKKINETKKEQSNLQEKKQEKQARLSKINERVDKYQLQSHILIEQQSLVNEQLLAELNNKSLEEWEEEAGRFPSLIYTCEQQLDIIQLLEENDRKANKNEQNMREYALQLEGEQSKLAQLAESHRREEQILNVLQKNAELQLLIQKYEADRSKLQKNEACFLCGSTHHPYIEAHYKNERNEYEQKLVEQKTKLEKLNNRLSSEKVRINKISNDIEHVSKEKVALTEYRDTLLQKFEKNNLNLPKPLEISNPTIVTAIIAQKNKQFNDIKNKVNTIKNKNKNAQELLEKINLLKDNTIQLNHESIQIEKDIEHLNIDMAKLDKQLKDLTQQQADALSQATASTARFKIDFVYEKRTALLQQLEQRQEIFIQTAENLTNQQVLLNQCERDLIHISANVNEKEKAIIAKEQALTKRKGLLQSLQEKRFTLFGRRDTASESNRLEQAFKSAKLKHEHLSDSLVEKQKEIEVKYVQQKSWKVEMAQLKEEYQQSLNRLQQQLSAENILSVNELKSYFLTPEKADSIQLQQKNIEEEKTKVLQSLKDTNNELNSELQQKNSSEPEESLLEKIKVLDTAISLLHQETGKINQILKADEDKKTQFQELRSKIENQAKEAGRWQRLSALIGSADGNKFSRFAQGLTLARLTELANRHLLKLSDRYQILKSKEKDLELQIIDHYQADVVRPMTTLSGGESFLVSLALALGLSDLASRKTQIQSLFIDEGFGTLDAETLDTAITALENLQANGKTIGIISHVEDLKERIGTQIQVHKQSGGLSQIKIIWPGRV